MNSIHQRPIFVPHSGTKSASFFTSSSSSTSQGPQKRKAYDETPDIRVEAEERVIHRAGPQSGAHEQDNTIKKHQMSKIESQIHCMFLYQHCFINLRLNDLLTLFLQTIQ